MAKRLRVVEKQAATSLSVPDDADELWLRSLAVWPHNESMRLQWLKQVRYLRDVSQKGWSIDKLIPKRSDDRIM